MTHDHDMETKLGIIHGLVECKIVHDHLIQHIFWKKKHQIISNETTQIYLILYSGVFDHFSERYKAILYIEVIENTTRSRISWEK